MGRCIENSELECKQIEQDLLIELSQDYVDIQNSEALSMANKMSFRRQFTPAMLHQIQNLCPSLPLGDPCGGSIKDRRLEAAIRLMHSVSDAGKSKGALKEYLRAQQKCLDDEGFVRNMLNSLGS
jgi:hypothetical protein